MGENGTEGKEQGKRRKGKGYGRRRRRENRETEARICERKVRM